jgi:NAD(P)-dependent dehydrogenase (short-subunit alcohol dehydrogenase family)
MYLEKFKLDGKTAVVTGAGQGIGLACAEALAEAGAKVIIADRDPKAAEAGRAALKAKGLNAEIVMMDVTDSDRVSEVADQLLSRFGKIDILVNNAGIARSETPAEKVTDEHWLNVVDVNLNGTFWCCRAFGKHMLEAKSDQVAGSGMGRARRAGQRRGANLYRDPAQCIRQKQSADVRCLDWRHTNGPDGGGRRNCLGCPVSGVRRRKPDDREHRCRRRRLYLLVSVR